MTILQPIVEGGFLTHRLRSDEHRRGYGRVAAVWGIFMYPLFSHQEPLQARICSRSSAVMARVKLASEWPSFTSRP
jgi:hypothetical protein